MRSQSFSGSCSSVSTSVDNTITRSKLSLRAQQVLERRGGGGGGVYFSKILAICFLIRHAILLLMRALSASARRQRCSLLIRVGQHGPNHGS
jgi:hypothetical protein